MLKKHLLTGSAYKIYKKSGEIQQQQAMISTKLKKSYLIFPQAADIGGLQLRVHTCSKIYHSGNSLPPHHLNEQFKKTVLHNNWYVEMNITFRKPFFSLLDIKIK